MPQKTKIRTFSLDKYITDCEILGGEMSLKSKVNILKRVKLPKLFISSFRIALEVFSISAGRLY